MSNINFATLKVERFYFASAFSIVFILWLIASGQKLWRPPRFCLFITRCLPMLRFQESEGNRRKMMTNEWKKFEWFVDHRNDADLWTTTTSSVFAICPRHPFINSKQCTDIFSYSTFTKMHNLTFFLCEMNRNDLNLWLMTFGHIPMYSTKFYAVYGEHSLGI